MPGLYEYCERRGLPYALGYATNAVLQRVTEPALADLELYYHFYGAREPYVQRFEEILDKQGIILRVDPHRVPDLILKSGAGQRELVVASFFF